MKQKGFAPLLLILIIGIAIATSMAFFVANTQQRPEFPHITPYPYEIDLLTAPKSFSPELQRTINYYPCAGSSQEAIANAQTEECHSVKVKEYPEYFAISYVSNNNPRTINVLNCNYFEATTDSSQQDTLPRIIGKFKLIPTKENVNHLVNFLIATQLLSSQACGFNCKSQSTIGIFEETNQEIIRRDKYTLESHNDIPPFETSTFSAEQQFKVEKETGNLIYNYKRS